MASSRKCFWTWHDISRHPEIFHSFIMNHSKTRKVTLQPQNHKSILLRHHILDLPLSNLAYNLLKKYIIFLEDHELHHQTLILPEGARRRPVTSCDKKYKIQCYAKHEVFTPQNLTLGSDYSVLLSVSYSVSSVMLLSLSWQSSDPSKANSAVHTRDHSYPITGKYSSHTSLKVDLLPQQVTTGRY